MNHWIRFTRNEQRGLILWSAFLMILTLGHSLLTDHLQEKQREEALQLIAKWSQSNTPPHKERSSEQYDKAQNEKSQGHSKEHHFSYESKSITSSSPLFDEQTSFKHHDVSYPQDTQKTATFENEIRENSSPSGKANTKENKLKISGPLNINKATAEEFEALGFPDYIAKRVCNFREKVRLFESVEDLKDIYGIDTFMVTALADQLKVKHEDLPKIQINLASPEEWQELRGIGAVYSKRIVEYRNRLGGFTSIDQINEVYGIDSELVKSIRHRLMVDSTRIHKININTASVQEMAAHPYISWREAGIIEKYKKQHGRIQQLADCHALSEEWIHKVKLYIAFQ